MEVKVSLPVYILEARGLVKLGIFSGEDLALYSWCIRLAARIAVSGRMYLVADMTTYANREFRPNIFGIPFTFLVCFELFCFALILKCGGLHILGLGGRIVKVCRALPNLAKTVFLHVD